MEKYAQYATAPDFADGPTVRRACLRWAVKVASDPEAASDPAFTLAIETIALAIRIQVELTGKGRRVADTVCDPGLCGAGSLLAFVGDEESIEIVERAEGVIGPSLDDCER